MRYQNLRGHIFLQAPQGSLLLQAQQDDEHLRKIREGLSLPGNPYNLFFLKDRVLYKRYPMGAGRTKCVICLPGVLLPLVIRRLHLDSGHSSVSATRKNFKLYYYNSRALQAIRALIQSCTTCAMELKDLVKKECAENEERCGQGFKEEHPIKKEYVEEYVEHEEREQTLQTYGELHDKMKTEDLGGW
jgi:hypothetical protein